MVLRSLARFWLCGFCVLRGDLRGIRGCLGGFQFSMLSVVWYLCVGGFECAARVFGWFQEFTHRRVGGADSFFPLFLSRSLFVVGMWNLECFLPNVKPVVRKRPT